MPDSITRRSFLHAAASASAYASLGPPWAAVHGDWLAAAPPAGADDLTQGWFDGPMRWAQLTLVENDPGRFDPQLWLDYFRSLHADAASLSAGGIVAYYPTVIPLHHRSAWLGGSDPFGTLSAGCRAMGMRVVARTDPHAARDEVRRAHPDWISVDGAGNPRRHWANPELWVTCALGPYNFEFMDRVHREIVSRYQVDGIFANRWQPQGGDCYCTHCQRNFRERSGLDLPRTDDPDDPARRRFRDWRIERLTELWEHWDARSARPTPMRGSSPTDRRTTARPAGWPRSSSPTTRHGAG